MLDIGLLATLRFGQTKTRSVRDLLWHSKVSVQPPSATDSHKTHILRGPSQYHAYCQAIGGVQIVSRMLL